jgi:endonuclease G
VATPDAFWKVIIRGTGQDERAIAWIVPNSSKATKNQLDRYLVTIADIEKVTGESIPVADYAKTEKPSQSWIIPQGCKQVDTIVGNKIVLDIRKKICRIFSLFVLQIWHSVH